MIVNFTSGKKRILSCIGLLVGTVIIIFVGIRLFTDRKYNMISVIAALFACAIFYITYEKRDGSIRRMVLLAVMTAISAGGRFLFAPIPGFKPVTAVVVLCGIYMGPESGFLVGSLSALVSNIFFGQGPWTPFQMLTWGTIGLTAGLPGVNRLLKKRVPLAIYGVIAGMLYTVIMNIWSVCSLYGTWDMRRYLLSFGTALPFTVVYAVSNVIFLMLTIKPIGEKLNRIQIKHNIF